MPPPSGTARMTNEVGRLAHGRAGRPATGHPVGPVGRFGKRVPGPGSAGSDSGPLRRPAAAGPCGSNHSDSVTVLSAPCGGEPGDDGPIPLFRAGVRTPLLLRQVVREAEDAIR